MPISTNHLTFWCLISIISTLLIPMFEIGCFAHKGYYQYPYQKHYKVLVLGAGISGIAAAESLWDNGIKDMLVLEAQSYIGGRIKDLDFDGTTIPLGDGRIQVVADDQPIWNLAKEFKLKVHFNNYTDFIVRNVNTGKKLNDELPVQKQLSEAIDEVNKAAEKRQRLGLSDISLKNALAQEGWIPNRAVQKAVEYFAFDFENAAPPASSSSIIYGITGEGQDVIVTDRRGYGHIPRTIARKFRDRVRLNTVVTKTDYSSYNIIKVSTESGEIYTADYVLVTFSSGVLINNQVVQFNPTLPSWKTNALNLVPVGYYCKIFMKFPRKFWDNNNYILLPRKRIQGDYVLWQNFEKETLFSGKNILQATLTGNDCLWTETLSDWEVIKEVMVKLEKVYGPNIPYPTDIARSDWSNNRFFMGAYSVPAVGVTEETYKTLQAPVGKRIWFAGEHMAGSKEYGSTHGAYKSGKKQASALVKCIKKGICLKYDETMKVNANCPQAKASGK